MKTILLAGGQSKRVQPVPDKCFVRLCGKVLIEWQLEALVEAGFDDLVIVGNASSLDRLKALTVKGAQIEVVEQTDPSGMKGALMAAKDLVLDDDGIFVVSSNDVVEPQLWTELQKALQQDVDGLMVGYRVDEYFPGGYLELNENGFVKTIVEKPGAGNEPSDLVNLVAHLHRDVSHFYAALESVSSESDDLYECALQKLFNEQKKYSVVAYDGFWQPVKYPWHLLDLNDFFLGQLKRSIADDSQIAETAVINGEVVIESGVRVFDHSVINGPAYIGKNSIVANFAMVRGSSLGERCVAGSFTEIARSLLQDDVWTHKNYVGDSIIGNNVSFGSGTVTGNLRLDEGEIAVNIQEAKVNSGRNKLGLITGENIRVGINTSFMPGVKIGSDCMLGAELNVAQDIAASRFVKAAPGGGLEIRDTQRPVPVRAPL